jgi:hypothetical protein
MEHIAEKLDKIVRDSLYRESEVPDGKPPADAVIVDGIRGKMGFHPQRLESHRAEVVEILREMSPQFFKGSGDGWTFLQLPADKHGNQWGEQRDANNLMVLAFGMGLGRLCLPREMWSTLPGAMPYVMFDLTGVPEATSGQA